MQVPIDAKSDSDADEDEVDNIIQELNNNLDRLHTHDSADTKDMSSGGKQTIRMGGPGGRAAVGMDTVVSELRMMRQELRDGFERLAKLVERTLEEADKGSNGDDGWEDITKT